MARVESRGADARRGADAALTARRLSMLKVIDPLLGPDLLYIMRAMGHGDELAIVDANYPADSAGPDVVRIEVDAVRTLDAVLTLFPLDTFVPEACWRMQVVGSPNQEEPVFEEFRKVIAKREGPQFKLASLERFAFYDRVKQSFAIVKTNERRLYGNVLLKKGIVRPE
jgi:L-fucose mutarotase